MSGYSVYQESNVPSTVCEIQGSLGTEYTIQGSLGTEYTIQGSLGTDLV